MVFSTKIVYNAQLLISLRFTSATFYCLLKAGLKTRLQLEKLKQKCKIKLTSRKVPPPKPTTLLRDKIGSGFRVYKKGKKS